MRLKLLFFPLILIICVFVLLNYILPEAKKISVVNEEKISIQKTLQNVEEKEKAVKTLSQQVNNNEIDKYKVDNYLPSSKKEEQIITGVNYLAGDSQVFLSNIPIVDSKKETSNSVAINNVSGEENKKKEEVQFSEVTIKIIGEYEKIQMFLGQIQRMPLFNNLKSIKIYSQGERESKIISDNENAEASQSNNILADIVVDFGYFNLIKISNVSDIDKFETTLDSGVITTLTEYTSQKMVSSLPSPNSVGEGKNNPFLP